MTSGRRAVRGLARALPLAFGLVVAVPCVAEESGLQVSAQLAWGGLQVRDAATPIRVECANAGEAWSGEIVLRPVTARLGVVGEVPFPAEDGLVIRSAVDLPSGSRKAYVFCPIWSDSTAGYEIELCRGGAVDARTGVGAGTWVARGAECLAVYLRADGVLPEGRRGAAWLNLMGRSDVAPILTRWAAAGREEWPGDVLELDPVRLVLVDAMLVQTEAPGLVAVLREWVLGGGLLALLPIPEGRGGAAGVWREWLGDANLRWAPGARAEGLGEVRWLPRDLLAPDVTEPQAAALARGWLRAVPAAATTLPVPWRTLAPRESWPLFVIGDYQPLLWLLLGYCVLIVGPHLWMLRRWHRREWVIWTMPILAVAGSVGIYAAGGWTSRAGARRALAGTRWFAAYPGAREGGGPLAVWHVLGSPASRRVRYAADLATGIVSLSDELQRCDPAFRVRQVGTELRLRLRSGAVAGWGETRSYVPGRTPAVGSLVLEGRTPEGALRGRLVISEEAREWQPGSALLVYAGHRCWISGEDWAAARGPEGVAIALTDGAREQSAVHGAGMPAETTGSYAQSMGEEWMLTRADPRRAYLFLFTVGSPEGFEWPGETWEGVEPGLRSAAGQIILDLGPPEVSADLGECRGWFVQAWADVGSDRTTRFYPGRPGESWDTQTSSWDRWRSWAEAAEGAAARWPPEDEMKEWRVGVVSWPGGVLYAELYPMGGGAGSIAGARIMEWPEEWAARGVVADLYNWEEGNWLRIMPGRVFLDPVRAFLEPVTASILLRLQSEAAAMLDLNRLCLKGRETAGGVWRDGD